MARYVYDFKGAGSRHSNAVFSSYRLARAWIRKHKLTGLLTRHVLNISGFDFQMEEGSLPKSLVRIANKPETRETYVDGRWHKHFVYGLGESDNGFREACDRWDAEYDRRHRS
jgi:hypothetical protein